MYNGTGAQNDQTINIARTEIAPENIQRIHVLHLQRDPRPDITQLPNSMSIDP